jgi:beta-galactosidase
VRNEHDFVSLDRLNGAWEVTVDGISVRRGVLPSLPLAPGAAKDVRIDLGEWPGEGEAHLTMRFATRGDTLYAKSGHEVGWAQFSLRGQGPALCERANRRVDSKAVAVEKTSTGIVLRGGDTQATFDRTAAILTSLRCDGSEMLARGPLLQLWRAATDNDGLKLWSGQESKALGRWRKLGLDRALAHRPANFKCRVNRDGSATVTLAHQASARGVFADCSHTHGYTLRTDGTLLVHNEVRLGRDLIDLPRVGVRIDFAAGLERVRYFGHGPWDNYRDRCASAVVGIYETTVNDFYVPYVMPQEHGHRTDVRWVELAAMTRGRNFFPRLRIEGAPVFECNLGHFTAEDLYSARHTTDLRPRAETIMYLDAAHRGVGTASCGPDTLPIYRLNRRRFTWSYSCIFPKDPRAGE